MISNKNKIRYIISLSIVIFFGFFSFALAQSALETGGESGGEINKDVVQHLNNSAASNQSSASISTTGYGNLGGLGWAVATVVGWIAMVIVAVFGSISSLLIYIIITVSTYNDFINVSTVINGWVIIRDVCNMFFILVLLAIAFGTILRQNNYSVRLLPKLLIMAVLINFSRTIFGLIIDVAQVIMMTFVNGFKDYGASQFINLFSVKEMLAMNNSNNTDHWGVIISMVAGVFASFVAMIVFAVLMVVLVARIIMLWIYVTLSPFVFLGWAFPPLQKYVGTIWDDFIKQVMVGPILAFFIWLALTTIEASKGQLNVGVSDKAFCMAGAAKFFCNGPFQTYIITIAFLMGGLMVTQKMGGVAGNIAGKGMAKIQQGRTWAQKRLSRKVQDVTRISAAREYLAARSAQKETIRKDRITGQAMKIAGGVGAIKTNMIQKPTNWVSKQWGRFGRNQAAEKRESANKDRGILKQLNDASGKEFEDISKNIDADLKLAGHTFVDKKENVGYRNDGGKWKRRDADGNVTEVSQEDVRHAMLNQKKLELEEGIEQKENEANDAMKKQKRADRIGKGLLGAGLFATGFVSGGAGWAGLGAGLGFGAMGYGAANEARKAAKDAGKGDMAQVGKYEVEQIMKNKDSLKNESGTEVLAKIDDDTKSIFVKMAAILEAMDRNLLSGDQVIRYRKLMQKEFGGAKEDIKRPNAEILDWNNKKLGSVFEAIQLKNYKQITPTMEKATKEGDRESQIAIEQAYNTGHLKMNELDIKTLQDSIDQLAAGLKTGKFVKDFADLNNTRQNAVIQALEKSAKAGNFNSKEKLARITDIERAFGKGKATAAGNEDKLKFVRSLSMHDLGDIISKGNAEQIRAFKEAIGQDRSVLAEHIMKSDSPAARNIRSTLEIPNA